MKQNVYLIGFMGAGKSFWGRKVAEELSMQFVDLDDFIEEGEGRTIRQIFEEGGETKFRNIEKKYLNKTFELQNHVIALGGGTPCFYDNMVEVNRHGLSFFLDVPVEELVPRLQNETANRPLIAGKTRMELYQYIAEKLAERRKFYEKADYVIKNEINPIKTILQKMKKNTLLLLHGALGSKTQLENLKNGLAKDYKVQTLNFTGHGGKDFGDSPFDIDLFTKDVLNYLEEQGQEQVDIFGYSMGGYVALNLAKNFPERVGKIFTLATKFAWDPASSAKEVKMLNPDAIQAKVPVFAQTLAERHSPQDWKTHLAKTAELMINLGNGDALQPHDFSSIQHEVILSVGDLDKMVSQEETKAVADAIPNAHFWVFKGVKHPIEKVDINLLVSKLSSFF